MTRVVAIFLGMLLLHGPALARERQAEIFDYYVLALSWSPSYCATHPQDHQQCAAGRAFDFVVHGLWPQFSQGWPQDCATDEAWVEQRQIDAMLDVMPSKALIIHEWKKHGTCAGLSQADYFRTVRNYFENVKIPARYQTPTADVVTTPQQLVLDFVKTNMGLTAEMVSVQCGRDRQRARLSELRVCFDKGGAFRACGRNEARQCQAETLVMPRSRQ
jgi:ribonuclease T2